MFVLKISCIQTLFNSLTLTFHDDYHDSDHNDHDNYHGDYQDDQKNHNDHDNLDYNDNLTAIKIISNHHVPRYAVGGRDKERQKERGIKK